MRNDLSVTSEAGDVVGRWSAEPAVSALRYVSRERTARHEADLAIIGFGFSGLAVLINLVRARARVRITVVASDRSGLGVAYGTRDPVHLLNVRAVEMGAWAECPEDFANWLQTPAARRASEALGVGVPAAEDYAPRALYANYLASLRDAALRGAAADAQPRFINARAERLLPLPGGGWAIGCAGVEVHARACVLATGNEPRRPFGSFQHPDLHDGWNLSFAAGLPTGPVVLIGSGLTAIDALLQLRSRGYTKEILMLSRTGALPQGHPRERERVEVSEADLAHITTLSDLVAYVEAACAAGHDCRAIVDGLRPHTSEIWQRLSGADQSEAVARWAPRWNRVRHRTAPEVAALLAGEVASGTLRVSAARRIDPQRHGTKLSISYEQSDGRVHQIHGVSMFDCTGQQLDCRQSSQPLLRGLVADGLCTSHCTGLGLYADSDLTVAEDLYGIGAILTGQLWETIAVPELRQQAALIAERSTALLSGAFGSHLG